MKVALVSAEQADKALPISVYGTISIRKVCLGLVFVFAQSNCRDDKQEIPCK